MNETLHSEQHNATERIGSAQPEHAAIAEDAKQANPSPSEERRVPERASSAQPESTLDTERAHQANPASSPVAPKPAWEGKGATPVNLVLEGGAMRGQFTAGVLDYFLEHGLFCDQVIGVSAGALNGYCYVSGEIGRTCFLNMKYCNDPRYLSMKSFVHTGNACGREFAFHEVPEKLDPFDFRAFANSPITLTAVSSDLELGEADYHVIRDLGRDADLPYLIASSSMPLVSQIVEVEGKKLLDGGTCDSVPITYSLLTGRKKHIVVFTQDATYEKGPNKLMPVLSQMYADFPYYLERLRYRHVEYNRTYRQVARMHEAGEVFAIQPQRPVEVRNMEHDQNKLLDLYAQGYAEAARTWDDLQEYLAK